MKRIQKPSLEKPIGQEFIAMNTLINASFLVDGEQLTLGGFLDLCALTEAVVLNEKLHFIPMLREETMQYDHLALFKQLLDEGILTEVLLNEEKEEKFASIISEEFSKYNGDSSIESLLRKIGAIMPMAKQYRESAYKQIYETKPQPPTPNQHAAMLFRRLEREFHGDLLSLMAQEDDIKLYMLGRVFMYYFLAGEMRMGFCPDYGRAKVLFNFFEKQYTSLTQEIYNVMVRKWNTDIEECMSLGNQSVLPIPPLGIILLQRCKDSRKKIPEVLLDLRKECATLRRHCLELELALLKGSLSESRKALSSTRKLSNAINNKYCTDMDERLLYMALRLSKQGLEYLLDPKKLLLLDVTDLLDLLEKRTTNQFISFAKKASQFNCDMNEVVKKIFGKAFSEKDISDMKRLSEIYTLPSIRYKAVMP